MRAKVGWRCYIQALNYCAHLNAPSSHYFSPKEHKEAHLQWFSNSLLHFPPVVQYHTLQTLHSRRKEEMRITRALGSY